MATRQSKRRRTQMKEAEEIENETKIDNEVSGYEELREQRIKENLERLQKLGILELSRRLKSSPKSKPPSLKKKKPSYLLSSDPPRRSSRLKSVTRVVYKEETEKGKYGDSDEEFYTKKGLKPEKGKYGDSDEEFYIKEGSKPEIYIKEALKPEIYTEEDEKLLGDYKTAWTLYVDGYGEDGDRIYDPVNGKSCHQCRQKTTGHRTNCSKCKFGQGHFCGDCLFTRYGENILEANENSSWICPICRGICNCSRCRREKGWAPTAALYAKVTKLGFKSVAHYLIQTHRTLTNQAEPAAESPVSANNSPSVDTEAKLSLNDEGLDSHINPDGISNPQSEGKNNVAESHSDDEYKEEDESNDDSDDDSDFNSDDD